MQKLQDAQVKLINSQIEQVRPEEDTKLKIIEGVFAGFEKLVTQATEQLYSDETL